MKFRQNAFLAMYISVDHICKVSIFHFSHKNHLVIDREQSFFALKYLVLWPQTWLEIVRRSALKNSSGFTLINVETQSWTAATGNILACNSTTVPSVSPGHRHVMLAWNDTFCGNVMYICHVQTWRYQWFAAMLTATILSWWLGWGYRLRKLSLYVSYCVRQLRALLEISELDWFIAILDLKEYLINVMNYLDIAGS